MSPKKYVPLNRGVPTTIPVIVKTMEDTPINLSGLKIYFTIKSTKYDFDRDDRFAIVKKEFEAQNPENGAFEIQLTAKDMDFAPGEYYFDVIVGGWRALNMPFELIGGPTNRVVLQENTLSHLNRTITVIKREPTPIIVIANSDPFLTNIQKQLKEEIVSELTVSDFKTVDDYLHEVWFTNVDYDLGRQHMKDPNVYAVGMCSSFKYGDYFGRNFDWIYDERPTFVCHIPKIGKRYASLNISNGPTFLKESMIKSGEYKKYLSLLPFYTLDGINERGVVCNNNVVPKDNFEGPSVPQIEVKDTINGIMLNRYILDNFADAASAASYIRDYISIEIPPRLLEMGYKMHWLISSGDETYVLEVINGINTIALLSEGEAIITNFNRIPVKFNLNGTVYSPGYKDPGQKPTIDNNLAPLAAGLERHNYLVKNIKSVVSEAKARQLLRDIYYTRTYRTSPRPSDEPWYSECVGIKDITVDSEPEAIEPILRYLDQLYLNRDRNRPDTWQTVHSSVYSISKKTLNLTVQEDKQFKFFL